MSAIDYADCDAYRSWEWYHTMDKQKQVIQIKYLASFFNVKAFFAAIV